MKVIEEVRPRFKTVTIEFSNGEVEDLISICQMNVSIPRMLASDDTDQFRKIRDLLNSLHEALDPEYRS